MATEPDFHVRIRPQTKAPFYEKNAFQGWAALCTGAVLTVIGMYQKPILAHWLLTIAWGAGSIACWKAANWHFEGWRSQVASTAAGSLALAMALVCLDKNVVPVTNTNVKPATASAKTDPQPAWPTAEPTPRREPVPPPPMPTPKVTAHVRITGYQPLFVVGSPVKVRIHFVVEGKDAHLLTHWRFETLKYHDDKDYHLKKLYEEALWAKLLEEVPKDLDNAEFLLLPAGLPSYLDVDTRETLLTAESKDAYGRDSVIYFAVMMLDKAGTIVKESCFHTDPDFTSVDLCTDHNGNQ
jgi:hypothetical protein